MPTKREEKTNDCKQPHSKILPNQRFAAGNLRPVAAGHLILPVLNDEFGNGQDESFPRPIGVEVDLVLFEEIKEVGMMSPGDAKYQ